MTTTTQQIYLEDSYLQSLKAKIIKFTTNQQGLSSIILDKTIFYPLGGGQPSDKGTISTSNGSMAVKSVEYNAGHIKHLGKIAGELAVGNTVALELNWPLRYKHLQWHTAGHLLDLVAREQYPNLTPISGQHGIGKQFYIEYSGTHKLDLAILNTNLTTIIQNNLPITTQFVTLQELKTMSNWIPERLPTSKKLRVLSIGDHYHIPDGGTQLKSSAESWPITITNTEIVNDNTRIHYTVSQQTEHSDTSKYRSVSSNIASSIKDLSLQFTQDLESVTSIEQLETHRLKYLSKKNGLTVILMQELPKLSAGDKKKFGPLLNQLKSDQLSTIKSKIQELTTNNQEPKIDLTIPVTSAPAGHLHPTTIVIREMNEFFRSQGFSIGEGPEIETPEYNFRKLNLPKGHPATDLQDTLFVSEPDLLLRTHTSSIETRMLTEHEPPLRVAVPGRVYRNETINATNSSFFYQYQGFVIDKGVNIQHLKDILTKFHQFLFGDDVVLRFRYKYYPEVSPGMGVDMQCQFCKGEGCTVCKHRGFIEVLGSGMIHYNTIKACGIDPDIYTGYAFGMGLDRLVMNKFKINDIRKLYGGDLVYA